MAGRPYVLAETDQRTVRATEYSVAILPWGGTAAHNSHLPYATDTIQVERMAIEAAGQAWEQGAERIARFLVELAAADRGDLYG